MEIYFFLAAARVAVGEGLGRREDLPLDPVDVAIAALDCLL